MNFLVRYRQSAALLTIALLASLPLLAQDFPPEGAPPDPEAEARTKAEEQFLKGNQEWKDERSKIKSQIDKQVKATVEKKVTPQGVAKELRLPYPVPPSTRPLTEIEDEVKERVEKEVEEAHPNTIILQFADDAEKHYAMYKTGDEVSFTIRGGMGRGTAIQGRLYDITEARVHVGNRWVIRGDMENEDLAHFYDEENDKMRKKMVHLNTVKHNRKREALRRELKRKYGPPAFAKAHYVYSRRLKRWLPKTELHELTLKEKRAQETKNVFPGIEREVYTKNGYIFKDGQWIPKSVVEAIQTQVQGLLAAPGGEGGDTGGGLFPTEPGGGGGGGFFDENQ